MIEDIFTAIGIVATAIGLGWWLGGFRKKESFKPVKMGLTGKKARFAYRQRVLTPEGWIGRIGAYGMEGWVRVDGGPNRFDWFREKDLQLPKAYGPCLCTYADDTCPYRGPLGGPQCKEFEVAGKWVDDAGF